VTHGYAHSHITVLYNRGEDFPTTRSTYQNHWVSERSSLTTHAMNDSILGAVMDSLGRSVVGSNDSILVWWTIGHGFDYVKDFWGGDSCIDTGLYVWTNESGGTGMLPASTIAAYFDRLQHYKLRVLLWSTCHSGCLTKFISANCSTVVLAAVQYCSIRLI